MLFFKLTVYMLYLNNSITLFSCIFDVVSFTVFGCIEQCYKHLLDYVIMPILTTYSYCIYGQMLYLISGHEL